MREATRIAAENQIASLPFEDLAANHAELILREEIDPSQICRTCAFVGQRLHMFKISDLLALRKSGTDVKTLQCQPGCDNELRNLYAEKNTRSSINADNSVRVSISKKPGSLIGKVNTCGQKLQAKCTNCTRLVGQKIMVVGGINSNGKVWKRSMLVGGHCSIGAAGIVANGRTVFCDRKPIVKELNEGSCFTCGNAQVFSNNWVSDYPSVVRADLTAYEMEQARLHADTDEVGLAIWAARQNIGTAYWPITPTSKQRTLSVVGLIKFFEADVISTHRVANMVQVKPAQYRPTGETYLDPNDLSTDNPNGKFKIRKELVEPAEFVQRGERVAGWTVRFRGAGVTAELSADCSDPTIGIVHPASNPAKVIVEIMSPWHRLYGLPDTKRVAYRNYPSKDCDLCGGSGQLTDPDEQCYICRGFGKVANTTFEAIKSKDRVREPDPDCIASTEGGCTPQRACYAHAKGLHVQEAQDGVEYVFPWHMGQAMDRAVGDKAGQARAKVRKLFKEFDSTARVSDKPRQLRYDPKAGYIVDGNNADPDPWIFRIQLRGLLERYSGDAQIRAAILHQFAAIEQPMAMTKARSVSMGLGAFMGIEPGKPYCTLNMANPNQGLNLREVFGDWFGDMRAVRVTNPLYARNPPQSPADPYFSWQQAMELEDWQRVTNPGERIAEEIVRNDHQLTSTRSGMPGFDRRGNRIEPFSMPANPDIEHLPVGGVTQTTAEFVDWLDQTVDVPISDEGAMMRVSHRWLSFGYEIKGRTGANKKRKTSGAQADVEVVKFDHDAPESSDEGRMVGFLCTAPSCGEVYAADEINDPENPTCIKMVFFDKDTDEVRLCGAPLRWDEQDREWEQGHTRTHGPTNPEEPYRRVGSPTMATGPNSARWQSDERMLRVGCDSWRPKPWVRAARFQRVASKAISEARNELSADWVGKVLTVEIEGEEMTFTIGTDISLEAPVVQAVARSAGQNPVKVTGGHGHRLSVKVISVE